MKNHVQNGDNLDLVAPRALTSGAGYTTIATGVPSPSYTNTGLTAGTTYYYVVTATNSAGSSSYSNEAFATPTAPVSGLQSWRMTHFGSSAGTGDAADDADPDGDGLANLFEYGTGGLPLDPTSAPKPQLALTVVNGQPRLSLTFNRIADPKLSYFVDATIDLSNPAWPETLFTSTGPANVAGPVTVVDTQRFESGARRFLRLRIGTTTE